MQRFQYYCCDGGPHIILPKVAAGSWRGVSPEAADPLDPTTDYGRVCAFMAPIATVAVGSHQAVVIGSSPMSAVKCEPNAVTFDVYSLHEWVTDSLDDLIDDAVAFLNDLYMLQTDLMISIPAGGAHLMAATDRLDEPDSESVYLPIRGDFHILHGQYHGPKGFVNLFRFSKDRPKLSGRMASQ